VTVFVTMDLSVLTILCVLNSTMTVGIVKQLYRLTWSLILMIRTFKWPKRLLHLKTHEALSPCLDHVKEYVAHSLLMVVGVKTGVLNMVTVVLTLTKYAKTMHHQTDEDWVQRVKGCVVTSM
jgi:hypothetical protein